jgi:hypothetical protein
MAAAHPCAVKGASPLSEDAGGPIEPTLPAQDPPAAQGATSLSGALGKAIHPFGSRTKIVTNLVWFAASWGIAFLLVGASDLRQEATLAIATGAALLSVVGVRTIWHAASGSAEPDRGRRGFVVGATAALSALAFGLGRISKKDSPPRAVPEELTGSVLTGRTIEVRDLVGNESKVANKHFRDCTIIGPAVFYIAKLPNVPLNQFVGCRFDLEGADIEGFVWGLADDPSLLVGAVIIDNCQFHNCSFKRIGFVGPLAWAKHFREQGLQTAKEINEI